LPAVVSGANKSALAGCVRLCDCFHPINLYLSSQIIMKFRSLSVFALASAMLSPVMADDVLDSVKEGTALYQEGNYNGAIGSFNYVIQLLNQKAAEKMAEFMPVSGGGWERSEPETSSAGGIFGGGITTSATYTKDGAEVKLSVAANSPLLQSIMMMMNNPMFLGDQKVDRVGGQKAVVNYDASDRSGSINIVVAGAALVTAEGSSVSLEEMKELAGKFNFKGLTAYSMQ
jgi:hypothetical protein